MDTLDAAVKVLTTAASKSPVNDKKLFVEMAGHASTHLVLLKLSSISEQVAEKLCNFLRTSFFTLYAGLTVPTLRLVSAIFETVYHERVLSAMGRGQEEQKSRWEAVLHALLGGVLDFLDNNHTTETKDAIGDTLFSTLGDICFSLSAPRTSVDLRCTGYNILIDSAASHQENQEKMRDPNILGGERLGSCIWRTKDYLALEGLLNLFARVLPSTNGSTSGRARRTAFVQSVFLRGAPPEFTTTGKEIVGLLERVSSSDWDETSLKIVDTMARASIIYPQPFGINEVVVSGTIYPSDRLYADDKTFLVNVVLEREDQYESLEVSYTAISKIRLSRSSAGRTHVILSLNSPPRLGKSFLEISVGAVVGFSLGVEDEDRLLQALRSRGLARMITEEPQPIQKLSVATEPTKLEIDSKGKLVKESTQNERIENLSQFYRTDEKSDDVLSAGDLEAFCPIETTSPLIGPSKVVVSRSHRREEGAKRDHPEPPVSSTKVPSGSSAPNLASTDSKLLFDAAFGTSDDELSEFTDEETPLPRTKILRRTSTSISIQGRISFEPASSKAVLPPARLARGGVGKVVLDSDDEAPPAPALKQSRNAKKALVRAPTTDTVATEDRAALSSGLEATTTSDVSTPGSEMKAKILVPATTSGQRSTTGKVLRFSDVHIPAPDFNAALSSPPNVPTSVLKSALVKRQPKLQASTLECSPCPSAAATVAKPSFAEKAAVKAKDVLDDLIPASSSPTPGAKKPVKAGLQKKGQTIADATPVQHVKRKAVAVGSDDDDVPLASHKKPPARPAKRTRSSPGDSPVSPKATPAPGPKASSPKKPSDLESPALRPPMQSRRRYHARKGRASSPRAAAVGDTSGLASGPAPAAVPKGDFADVDYDELPNSPPRRSAAAGAVKKSSSPAAKPKQEPVKTAAKTKEAFEGGKVEKTRKKTGDKTGNSGNTVKSTTVEKPANADATKTSPEGAKPAMEDVKPRTRSMAQKDNATSNASAATKMKAHELDSSANANEFVAANASEGGDAANAASRVLRGRPRPRRAAASATKAKEEDSVRSAFASASEPELAVVSPVLERTRVRTDERNTNTVTAETFDVADIAVAVANDATGSDLEVTFLEDAQPPQPEMVSSDPSTVVNNFTEDACSSSKSAASKPKTVKARSVATPWDAMAQHIKQPQQSPPDSPSRVEPVMAVAEDCVQAPALDATMPGNASTDTCTVDTKDVSTTLVRTRAETSETAVQTTSTTVSPTAQVEPKPVVIDLTLDSPPKPICKRPEPKITPVAPSHENVDTAVEDALGRQNHAHPTKERLPQPVQHSHVVRFASPTELPSMHARYGQERSREQLRLHQMDAFRRDGNNGEFAEAGDETLVDIDCGSGDPGLDAIVDVLNKLHQVVVGSIAKKFEGVREEVRAGRDELLRYAAADLHVLHAQSVTHFNRLVDLEAQYATVGRNVLYANEDWVNMNQQAYDALAVAVEKHDRGTLSKQMPVTLVTLKL